MLIGLSSNQVSTEPNANTDDKYKDIGIYWWVGK